MILIILVCVCFCLYRIFKKHTEEPPVLSGRLPIIGHLHRIVYESYYELIKEVGADCTKNGGVITLDLVYRKICIVTDPDDCLTIANECLEKDRVYLIAEALLGKGLLVSDVPTWKKHRKLLNPAFSQPVLNTFVETFNTQARSLVQMLSDGLGEPIDHENLLRLNNLETIIRTATGIRKEDGVQKQYIVLISEILQMFTKRFQQFWLHIDIIFNMSQLKKKQDEIIGSMTELSNQIIETKKAEMRNDIITSSEKNKSGKYGQIKGFMDLILELANDTGCFTDQEVREETNTIIAAGHDTTASILTFLFTLLGSYPNIQDKVYDEVQETFGNAEKDLDKDDLSKLVYTEAVLKETLRLYPVATIIGRYSDKPVKLKNYTIKANTGFFLMLSDLNRHPMWGPDADQFKPERWLDAATLPDLTYFGGFGLGRRACIGKVYAMMSMKVIVAHVIRRYRMTADVTKMELVWEIMPRPHGTGHHVTLQLRK